MEISYNDRLKSLPNDKLQRLILLAGWSEGDESEEILSNFKLPLQNSTLVIFD